MCFTVFITGNQDSCYDNYSGNLPDFTRKSLKSFIALLNNGYLRFCGENRFNTFGEQVVRGGLTIFNYKLMDFQFPIISAGRYFGNNHYLAPIDYYSYVLRTNKNTKSKLYRKFDCIFTEILNAMISRYKEAKEIKDFILLNVPTKPSKENRFSEIITTLCSSFSIPNNSTNFICTCDYEDNKFMSKVDRRRNVEGVFSYNGDLTGKIVFLIDDIITTGGTVGECVSVLKSKGASDIAVFTLAINQYACNYWLPNSKLNEFSQNNELRCNSKDLSVFFSNQNNNTTSYNVAINKLISDLNDEIGRIQPFSEESHEF